jgi:hypothetical protein
MGWIVRPDRTFDKRPFGGSLMSSHAPTPKRIVAALLTSAAALLLLGHFVPAEAGPEPAPVVAATASTVGTAGGPMSSSGSSAATPAKPKPRRHRARAFLPVKDFGDY